MKKFGFDNKSIIFALYLFKLDSIKVEFNDPFDKVIKIAQNEYEKYQIIIQRMSVLDILKLDDIENADHKSKVKE